MFYVRTYTDLHEATLCRWTCSGRLEQGDHHTRVYCEAIVTKKAVTVMVANGLAEQKTDLIPHMIRRGINDIATKLLINGLPREVIAHTK